MSPACEEELVDETGFLGGKVLLRQARRGHRAGTDAALLVAAARPYGKGRVVDLGAGVGAIGLSLAMLDPTLELVLVEIDPLLARLAVQSAADNGCGSHLRVVNADVRVLARDRDARGAMGPPCDLVVMNPPFTNPREQQASPDSLRASAHMMAEGELALWIGAAASLLKAKGALVMIHRPDALADLVAALRPRFGGISLRAVHPRADKDAVRLLVLARKAVRAPLAIAPPLVLHEADGALTPLAAAIHRGEAVLGFR